MRRQRILVAGEICRELTLSGVGDLSGETITSDGYRNAPGGSGASIAAALAFFGNDTAFVSRVGDDQDGRSVMKYVTSGALGINGNYITAVKEAKTPLHIVIPTAKGKKTVKSRQKECDIGFSDIADAFICYPDATVLVDGIAADGYRETAGQVLTKGGKIYVLSAPDDTALRELGSCEVLSLTDTEAAKITGVTLKSQESCMNACIALSKNIKSNYTVIRMRDRGCFVYDGTFYTFIPYYELPGGDDDETDCVFCAELVNCHFSRGYGINEACEHAAAAVAVYVTRGRSGLPSRNDIDAFMERNGQ